MSNTLYLVRADNRTLFDIGTWKTGFHEIFEYRKTEPLPPTKILRRLIHTRLIQNEAWEELSPAEARAYAVRLAERMTGWAGGQPVKLRDSGEGGLKGYRVTGDRYVNEDAFSVGDRVGLPDDKTGVIKKRIGQQWRDPDFRIRIDGSGQYKRYSLSALTRLSLLEQLPPEE